MDNWIAAGVSEAKLFRAMTIENARVMRLDECNWSVAAPSDAEINATFEKIGTAYIDIYTALNPVAASGDDPLVITVGSVG